MRDAAVIGAGAAGLTAARILAEHGRSVTLIEARNRVGGRLHSLQIPGVPGVVELGAEFLHGTPGDLVRRVRDAGLTISKVGGRRYCADRGGLQPCGFLDDVFGLMETMQDYCGPDLSFSEYLGRYAADASEETLFRAAEFIQGFDAAEPERVSVHWLQRSGAASGQDNGHLLFRLQEGYGALAAWMARQLPPTVQIQLSTGVRRIEWSRGRVRVHTSSGDAEFRHAVLTVPAPVLPEIVFDPPVSNVDAAARIASGAVVRVSFVVGDRFRNLLPELHELCMIHSHDSDFPAWWPSAGGHVLTAWAGGPRATRLARFSSAEAGEAAIASLCRILNVPAAAVREHVLSTHTHNWQADPFARGAYSWIPVGQVSAVAELAANVEQTLFFAGEASSLTGRNGLVHGAIETGQRAAEEILGLR